ncbi:MAG: polymerase [Candidatus Doudnabacteria bacterium]|nr:polymerase [Candidatus Doudnabacteria bacterium]
MKFARDILLIDMETTGPDPYKDFPIQLSAILLDKDNLLEKGSFNSYIKHPFSQTTNDRVVQTLGIPKEMWMKAPNLKAVITAFKEKFPYNVTISSQNIINVNFLQESFRKTGISYEYDYHILELWTLSYFYLSKQNIKKIPTAETVGAFFKLQRTKEHDALANCRFLADILRKLTK